MFSIIYLIYFSLYEYESILIQVIKFNGQFSSIDVIVFLYFWICFTNDVFVFFVQDETIRKEINEKCYCQLMTKLKNNDQTVYELNSCYQIRRALVENKITEDDCDTGYKIWRNQKKLNVSIYRIVDVIKMLLSFS